MADTITVNGITYTVTVDESLTTVTTSGVGIKGDDGVGVPPGGTLGQVLSKASGTDYDTQWVPAGGATWGAITGTLSDQTDLQSALNGKADTSHTHTASDITDFDAEVANNTSVSANTSARHDAVTVTDTSEVSLTLTGQDISASLVSGSIDESKLDASVNASLDLADSSVQPGDNISTLTNDSGFITGYTVTESDVTQHEAALTITESQISDLSHFSGDYNDLTNKPDLSALNEISVSANQAAFPATGESDTVYIAEDTGYMFRWNGSSYTQLTDQTAIWGQITGTLSDQSDLQSVLDGKADSSHTHTESDITDLGDYSEVGHTHTLSDVTDSGDLAALDTVDSAQIVAEAVTEAKLDVLDSPADGEVLSYDSGTGRFEWVAQSAGVTDHGALSGLSDDDHTQYSLADGTRDYTGIVSYNTHPTFTSDTEIVDKKYVDDSITAGGGYTDEDAQDAVGAMLTGTQTRITVTYDDPNGELDFVVDDDLSNYDNTTSGFITDYTVTEADVTQHEGAIDHDALTNYVASEHIDWSVSQASDIHPDNYTDTDTTYTAGTGVSLVGTEFSSDDSAIDHNSLQNYSVDEHRTINDTGSGTTDLWSASKISTELSGKANSSHTHTASEVTDFDTEVSNNTDVSANTAARHDAVTVTDSSEIDFTLTGQDITASLIAGSIDESKLDTSVNASLDLADSALQSGDNVSELTNDSGYITATLTDEEVEDIVGPLVATGGTKTLITVTYDDANGNMDFVVDNDLSNYDNGTSGFLTEVTTADIAASTLIVESEGIASNDNDTTIPTSAAVKDYVDNASSSGTTLTEEEVQDFAWNVLTGTQSGITVTYDDANNEVDFTVDTASPGQAGVVELATDAETIAGSDGTRAVTPLGLKNAGYFIPSGTEANNDLLVYNSGTLEWVATSYSEAGLLQNVVEDTSPQLGGNLDLNSNDITGLSGSDTEIQFNDSGTLSSSSELTFTGAGTASPSLNVSGATTINNNLTVGDTSGSTGGVVFKPTSLSTNPLLEVDFQSSHYLTLSNNGVEFETTLDANNQDIQNIKLAEFQDEHDNGNSGTSETIDWGEGNNQQSTLTGNVTFSFTDPTGPSRLQLKLIQDGTGSRTVTWPTIKWVGGTAPTLSTAANAEDIITLWYDGTSYYGIGSLDFS